MNRPATLLALLLGLLLSGCMGIDDPPFGGPATCNNSGQCDGNETCQSCPADCPCCTAIRVEYAEGVTGADKALYNGDGAFATLGENSTLVLSVGGKIANQAGLDFLLQGQVTSQAGTNEGYFTVYVLEENPPEQQWVLLDRWDASMAQTVNGTVVTSFDLGSTTLVRSEVRQIRIEGLPRAQAKLDALKVANCVN